MACMLWCPSSNSAGQFVRVVACFLPSLLQVPRCGLRLRLLPLSRLAQLSPVVALSLSALQAVTCRGLRGGRARRGGRRRGRLGGCRGGRRGGRGFLRGKGGAGVTEVAAWDVGLLVVVGVEQELLVGVEDLVCWVGWVG